MTRLAIWFALAALPMAAQTAPSPAEQQDLRRAISESANSPIEMAHALEHHLQQYPNSPQKAEIERALMKSAIDLTDDRRILLYGEDVLARDPDNRQYLQVVSAAQLRSGDHANVERALVHARHLDEVTRAAYKDDKFVPGGGREVARRKDEFDRALASVLIFEARAQGLLDHKDDAIKLAESSYQLFPAWRARARRPAGSRLPARDREAIEYLAEAFTIGGVAFGRCGRAPTTART